MDNSDQSIYIMSILHIEDSESTELFILYRLYWERRVISNHVKFIFNTAVTRKLSIRLLRIKLHGQENATFER